MRRSKRSFGKLKDRRRKLSIKDRHDAVKMYQDRVGSAIEIARVYGVHFSTIYKTLDKFGVQRHHPAKKLRLIGDGKGGEIVAESQPVQQPVGVDIDAVHKAPKRRSRRPKSWWQRLKDRLFGR